MFPNRKSSLWLSYATLLAMGLGVIASLLAGVGVRADVEAYNTTGLPLQLPRGFAISVYAKGLGKPTGLAWDDQGNMLVLSSETGSILAVRDSNRDDIADQVKVVATGLNQPRQAMVRCDQNEPLAYATPQAGLVQTDLPPCTLYVATADSVEAFQYETKQLSASGESVIARSAPTANGLFGSTALADNSGYCGTPTASASEPAIAVFCGAANAGRAVPALAGPTSVTLPNAGWPPAYHGSILVPLPQAHAIERVAVDGNGQVVGRETFIGGWLTATGRLLGTPSALLAGPAHSPYISDLYVADESSGTIYRIYYKGIH